MRRFLLIAMITGSCVTSLSQPADGQSSPPTDNEPDFIVPARPTVSNPAEFQRPGVLQLEFGYNGNFHSQGSFNTETDFPLAIRFAVNRRILLEVDNDGPYSLTSANSANTGEGDMQLGIQGVLLAEKGSRPGVAVAYYIKIPTGNPNRGFGTGRADHNFIGLFSKTVKKTTIDFNAIYLLAGRTSSAGHDSSGQAAFAVTQGLTKRFGIQGEISGASRNDQQAGAMYTLGVVTYQLNRRVVFDSGVRFGLTPNSARAGAFAGITVGVADFYKRHH
jgi:hypothetical protein